MDLGPLVPIVAILSGLGWGVIGLQKRKLTMSANASSEEAEGLRAENRKLAERIAVLERIATDKPSRLSAEIDGLASLPPRRETTE
ncbi:hypothetical protein [Sphingomonas jaspsi]|uniref:hypothetical protein n=1 Tax=Sphingomonas jaspsi TaxID=392409 RepID=UPI0004BBF7AB|nr:hypothetical protein [Sphingomonas jaspsi]